MNPSTPTFLISPRCWWVGMATSTSGKASKGPGSPERATLVTGLRGTGKDVMLNAYEDLAKSEGWVVSSEMATPNLIDRATNNYPSCSKTLTRNRRTRI
ncbi:hypothetical protein [Flexivirga oryzae]|uniref:ATP-binding protein n=1 Tax=Flexivirga oryzae TaxID=1794944 RepID=A0A839N303_9MICO|nr:hypothetical protein [Flexivirga oryzae]MBB2892108.1 hypothetical protein [Flexivirga oryzae]